MGGAARPRGAGRRHADGDRRPTRRPGGVAGAELPPLPRDAAGLRVDRRGVRTAELAAEHERAPLDPRGPRTRGGPVAGGGARQRDRRAARQRRRVAAGRRRPGRPDRVRRATRRRVTSRVRCGDAPVALGTHAAPVHRGLRRATLGGPADPPGPVGAGRLRDPVRRRHRRRRVPQRRAALPRRDAEGDAGDLRGRWRQRLRPPGGPRGAVPHDRGAPVHRRVPPTTDDGGDGRGEPGSATRSPLPSVEARTSRLGRDDHRRRAAPASGAGSARPSSAAS